jgi:NhaP-type Na+/H+ or K+/H+ antiporter
MDTHHIILTLGGIAVAGMTAQWLAWRLRLPSILLLLLVGLAAGPVTGWLSPDALLGGLLQPLVSLAVAVILFEGGSTLDLRELKTIGGAVLRLCTVGVLATWALATAAGVLLAGLSIELAVLLGSILTVTGPTVVGPLLNHVRPKGDVGPVLKWEGIVADVIGATLAVLVLHAIADTGPGSGVGSVIVGLLKTIGIGAGIGFVGAYALIVPLQRHAIPDHLQSPITLGFVLGVFVLADRLQPEAGLLAVTLMGIVMSNQRRVSVSHIVEFKENLRVLLISALFLLLAARVSIEDLRSLTPGSFLFLASLILIVRPVSTVVSLWRSGFTKQEQIFTAWMAPRGVVAAAVAALFATRLEGIVEGAEMLTSLAFLVIIGTVLVYGITAAPLARRLGLSEEDPRGCLLVGGGPFAETLARTLQGRDVPIVLADTNRSRVAQLKLEGLPAVCVDVVAEHAVEHIPMGGLGRMLALTPNDEVNRLAAMHFVEYFGRAGVFQLSNPRLGDGVSEMRGRPLFAGSSYGELNRRVAAGAQVKATTLSSEFLLSDLQAIHGARSLALMTLSKSGALAVLESAPTGEPPEGTVLIHLVDADG